MVKKINLLHPFTGKAAGVIEKSIPQYHSQIHAICLNKIAFEKEYKIQIDYFTSKFRFYNKYIKNLEYRFFPVNYDLKGNFKKFRKQESKYCIENYENYTPDVTIINMSGHSSEFCFNISKIILSNKKKYIAMLGGQHFSYNLRNREYYRNADHILVHTNYLKKRMLKHDLFKGLDVRIFPLGIDTKIFRPKNKIEKRISNKKIKLLYVGMIVERKRIHISINVVLELVGKGFEDVQFDIIGPVVSRKYFIELKNYVKKKGLEKNINFIKQINYIDLTKYYQNADLFMFPSDRETFGMVIIESMACGTPVAAIDCLGGPSEVLEHNVNGILTSIDDYASAIIKYLLDLSHQVIMKKNALDTVLNYYTIKNTYDVLKKSIDD